MNSAEIDLGSPAVARTIHTRIDAARADSFWLPTPNGRVFFNQQDAIWVMSCNDFRFSFPEIDATTSPYLARAIEHELLNMHGQAHARMRRLVGAAIRDRVEESLKDRIAEIAHELVDEMPDGGPIDLCAAFAEPLPGRVLGPLYGIPYGQAKDFNEWIRIGGRKSDALIAGEPIAEIEAANRSMHDYLRSLLAERRSNLGNDMFSDLIRAEVDGDRLTEDELVYLTSELASAGVDTTRDQLPLILLALLEEPERIDLLRASPDRAMAAVDEGMRFAPLPWLLPHTATHDVSYKGLEFCEGDRVDVLVPAVNRDPLAMERPHEFDLHRARARNFSFGQGTHACPAAQLARVEMAIALEVLVERTSSIRLIEKPQLDPPGRGRVPTQLIVDLVKR